MCSKWNKIRVTFNSRLGVRIDAMMHLFGLRTNVGYRGEKTNARRLSARAVEARRLQYQVPNVHYARGFLCAASL